MTFTSTELLEMADAFEPTSRVHRALRQAASDREDAERLDWLEATCVQTDRDLGQGSQLYFGTYATVPLREAIDQARQESRHG